MQLDRCRPFITGASRGIGRAFVDAFLAVGAPCVYAGVRNREGADRLAAVDPRITPVIVDTTRQDQVLAAAELAADADILVNNAGVLHYANLLNAPNLDAARNEMDVNYFGPLAMARAFAPSLIAGQGAVVNILSIAALTYMPLVGSYCPSKAAARSMTAGLRDDFAPSHVRVIAVYAGGYDTEMHLETTNKALLNPPSMLTDAVLHALENGGSDEIFPDAASQAVGQSLGLFPA